jgi:hypothetical protein
MGFVARVEPLSGKLPSVTFKWDPETEILAGHFKGTGKAEGLTGSVELEGSDGSFALLDVAGGRLRGLEVVVWPETQTVVGLTPPAADRRGRLVLPAHESQPGLASVEVDTLMVAEKAPDDSVIHLRVGPPRQVQTVQVADNLLLELDEAGEIAGFWLSKVPPFPQVEEGV